MKQTLLYKTLRIYIVFSMVVLVVTAPVFYFFTGYWHRLEADEALSFRLQEFEKFQLPYLRIADIEKWNHWNSDVQIEKEHSELKESTFFTGQFHNIFENEHDSYRVLRAPIVLEGKPFVFFAREGLLDNVDLVFNIFILYIAIILGLTVVLFFITKYFSRRLWAPFYFLLNELENFEIDKVSTIKMPSTTTDEFRRMISVSEKLISRNVSIYNNQKEFIENAAHELQTPLAVMQAQMDNLIQTEQLSDTTANSMDVLNSALNRLSRLNKNLLLLSRLDYDLYDEKVTVSLAQMLTFHLDFLKEQAEADNIHVNISLVKDVKLHANLMLLETLLSNLLTNALRHNKRDGIINIEISERQLFISNSGQPDELQVKKLFARFSKFNAAGHGSGLGLSIAKKIADQYQWNLSYHFKNSLHVFILNFENSDFLQIVD